MIAAVKKLARVPEPAIKQRCFKESSASVPYLKTKERTKRRNERKKNNTFVHTCQSFIEGLSNVA